MVLSGASAMALEKVRDVAPASWFQAYLPVARDRAAALAHRVWQAGFPVLVVTVDVPVMSNRSHYHRLGFSLPVRPSARLAMDAAGHPRWLIETLLRTHIQDGAPHYENFGPDRGGPLIGARDDVRERSRLCWDDIAALREVWPGRLVLKGLLHPADAVAAAALGVDGIVVSNHGGRQLDQAIGSLDALPAMVAAAPEITMMLDGGVRRGSDVVKAIALGAKVVFIGRPFFYAMAIAGYRGVRRAARILKDELGRDLAMLGLTEIAEVSPDVLA